MRSLTLALLMVGFIGSTYAAPTSPPYETSSGIIAKPGTPTPFAERPIPETRDEGSEEQSNEQHEIEVHEQWYQDWLKQSKPSPPINPPLSY
ncbi:hypothetical protein P154DRAFT_568953 [Amniculicola lignicola CBS 123094]|uniref:Secreted protein n=1 Tax=Amniculicola lignicola CBS 123094 TaxID=1392246 RepID=A0A6A5X5E4_9PLEO|nr:hypothetical protein P154DRAFT_568953 [Amniculicola lignicola CBS 123094]